MQVEKRSYLRVFRDKTCIALPRNNKLARLKGSDSVFTWAVEGKSEVSRDFRTKQFRSAARDLYAT